LVGGGDRAGFRVMPFARAGVSAVLFGVDPNSGRILPIEALVYLSFLASPGPEGEGARNGRSVVAAAVRMLDYRLGGTPNTYPAASEETLMPGLRSPSFWLGDSEDLR